MLAWVKRTSPLLENLSPETRATVEETLLLDFICLLSHRWNIELTLLTCNGERYAYGSTTRFTAAERTIKAAIGDLGNHVDILRGSASASGEDLARYKQCKEKWKVPDQITESSSGWGESAQEGTSTLRKRPRF